MDTIEKMKRNLLRIDEIKIQAETIKVDMMNRMDELLLEAKRIKLENDKLALDKEP